METAFYQLETIPLERALPRLLEKIYATRQPVVVLVDTPERLPLLDGILWTYAPGTFLPHGSSLGHTQGDRQPIWLTVTLENPNNASVLVVTSGQLCLPSSGYRFERILDLFDSSDSSAQMRYQRYKEEGFSSTYWSQNAKGGWEKSRL